jgi:hypothetical protein
MAAYAGLLYDGKVFGASGAPATAKKDAALAKLAVNKYCMCQQTEDDSISKSLSMTNSLFNMYLAGRLYINYASVPGTITSHPNLVCVCNPGKGNKPCKKGDVTPDIESATCVNENLPQHVLPGNAMLRRFKRTHIDKGGDANVAGFVACQCDKNTPKIPFYDVNKELKSCNLPTTTAAATTTKPTTTAGPTTTKAATTVKAPTCNTSNCKNGKCDKEKDKCKCNKGYKWNDKKSKCEAIPNEECCCTVLV